MTLHYASPLHNEDDPGGLIGQAFAMGDEFPGPAEDLLLSWMLRLPQGADASAAAGRLLQRYLDGRDLPSHPPSLRLVELLRETAEAPSGARRGGRRRRAVTPPGGPAD